MKCLCLSYDYITIFDIFLQFIVTSLSIFLRPIRLIFNFDKTQTLKINVGHDDTQSKNEEMSRI